MSNDSFQASFRASEQKVQNMVERAAIVGNGDPYHDDLYVNIGDGEVRTIAGSQGNVVVSYNNCNDSYLDEIEGSCEAVLDVSDFLTWLDIASDGGMVEVTFHGSDDQRLSQQVEIDGMVQSKIMLPGSKAVLEEVPLTLPEKFNDDNVMTNSEGDALGTHVSTEVGHLQKIIDTVDAREDTDFYPIVVKNGSFRLDIGDEKSTMAQGPLPGSVVEPTEGDGEVDDIENRYNEGFEELVNTLTSDLDLYTSQDAPLCVVQEKSGIVIRHSLGNVG